MDEVLKVLNAKPSNVDAPKNIGLWIVEEASFLNHISKVAKLGITYPVIFQIVGGEVFMHFGFYDSDQKLSFVVPTRKPEIIKKAVDEVFSDKIASLIHAS
tara:strand:- start:3930 stop:4232 length:303 start_codon:yes stop_codon:yes gene_type:complete